MKKLLLPVITSILLFVTISGSAQYCGNSSSSICTPQSGITTVGFYPPDTALPCLVDGQAYQQVINFHTPAQASGYNLNWIQINQITNLPCGICWASGASNNRINGNATGCVRVTGTTYDAPGEYLIKVFADVNVTLGFFPITLSNVNIDSVEGLKYYSRVQLPGGTCAPVDTLSLGLTAHSSGTITQPSISGSTTICPGGSTTLTATGASYYAYVWSNGSFSSSINVTSAGTYTVTVYDKCTTATATKTVTLNTPTATISAGGPTTFCQGGSVLLTASANTSYLWSTGATTQSISVSTSNSYKVTVTNSSGCTAASTATVVTVNSNPTAGLSAAGPTSFCPGGSVTLNASGGGTYLWSTGATTASISTGTTGSYNVTVTNANSCTAAATAIPVTVYSAPDNTVTPSGTTTFCSGGNVTLTAAAGLTYLWSTAATTQSIVVTQTGSYTVTVTTGNNCTAISSATAVTVNTNPTVAITPAGPTTFCQGGSVSLSATSGLSTYTWSNSATTQSISAITAGAYAVTVTNASGCSATAGPVTVTVNSLPTATITAGGPTSFCTGGNVTLSAPGGLTYLWSTAATTQSINVTQSGNYTVTVTNSNSCSAASNATSVTVNSNPTAAVTPGGPTTFCNGSNVTLSGAPGLTYAWSNGATTQSIIATSTNTYTLTVTNGNNCSAVSSPVAITVNANPGASVNATGPTTFCQGGSVTLNAPPGLTYLWSNTTTGQNISVNQSGTYYVTVTDGNNCTAASTGTVVTVNSLPDATVTAGGPTTFCAGNSVTLNAAAGLTYLWNTAATTQGITVTQGGNYSVIVTNSNNCSATSAITSVTVNPATAITLQPVSQSTCVDGDVTFSVTATGLNLTYLWSLNGTSTGVTGNAINIPNAQITDTGSYTVSVTGQCGSVNSNPATLAVTTSLDISQQPASQVFCQGSAAYVSVIANGSGTQYQWVKGGQPIGGATSATYTINTFSINDTGSYYAIITSNCGDTISQTATLGISLPTSSSLTASICQGGSYLFNGLNLTNAGVYADTLTGSNGCDSVVTLNLTVNTPSATDVSAAICNGGDYTFNGQTLTEAGTYTANLQNVNGCDSVVTLHLTVAQSVVVNISDATCAGVDYDFNGQILTATGIYTDTLTGANGCDSVVILALTVNPSSTSSSSATICQGSSYQFYGQTLTTGGTYTHVMTNQYGCDSTESLTLTVNATSSSSIAATICEGSTYTFNGADLANSGTYFDTLINVNGCDSIVQLTLIVNQPTSSTIDTAICSGSSFDFNGIALTDAGTYIDTLTGSNGCDSIVTLNLLINQPAHANLLASICQGDSFLFNGQYYTQAGTYTFTGIGSNGCDSLASVTLNVDPAYHNTLNVSICQGATYHFGNNDLTASGVYVDSSNTVNGCDSITTLNLQVNAFVETDLNASICAGSIYTFNGHSLTNSGIYRDTLTAAGGCDSIVVLTLAVAQPVATTITGAICAGTTYNFNGALLTDGGVYHDTLTSTLTGCDSIVTLNLTVNSPAVTNINASICQGGTYNFNGQQLNATGVYTDTLVSSAGCDSFVILNLQVTTFLSTSISASTCEGSPYNFNGHAISTSGVYYDTLTAQGGCDSIITLDLSTLPVANTQTQATICAGQSYNFNGTLVSAAGSYNDTLTGANGCDSIITLTLTVNPLPLITWFSVDTLCDNSSHQITIPHPLPVGGTYSGNGVSGTTLTTTGAGNYTVHYSYTDGLGCTKDTSKTFYVRNCLGIDEDVLNASIEIYPNPVSEALTVQSAYFDNLKTAAVIFDAAGKEVSVPFTQQANKLVYNTNKLAPGIYWLRLNVAGTTVTRHFVKVD